jgi:hypothetical protein
MTARSNKASHGRMPFAVPVNVGGTLWHERLVMHVSPDGRSPCSRPHGAQSRLSVRDSFATTDAAFVGIVGEWASGVGEVSLQASGSVKRRMSLMRQSIRVMLVWW